MSHPVPPPPNARKASFPALGVRKASFLALPADPVKGEVK